MRKLYYVVSLFALMLSLACNKDSYDDSKLWEKVNSLDYRVTNLEATISQMNSDIRSISDIVNALKGNVSVTSVVETSEGQKITFSDGKSIVIKNGKDGRDGVNGETPFIGSNGNWWIGTTDTGVKAAGVDGKNGTDGLTPVIGSNGNWWIGTTDTGVKAFGTDGQDGQTPFIGANGNWWIGSTDTHVKAAGTDGKNGQNGQDGLTPHIGPNGNWWIGQQDTGVAATGFGGGSSTTDVPIISIKEENGVYYWVQILNGNTTWLTDKYGNKLPVSGKDGKDGKDGADGKNGTNGITPLLRVDSQGYWQVSYDGGKNYSYVTNEYGQRVSATSGSCNCKQFFQDVYIKDNYLYLILIDGSVIVIKLSGGDSSNVTPQLPRTPNIVFPNPKFVVVYEPGRGYVLRIYILGFKHPTKDQWMTYSDGTDGNSRNTWIDIDDEGQVIDIYKPSNEGNKTMPTDLTFLVDNSGSMSEEADVLARDILSWSQQLTKKGIDIKFGVVGYSETGTINGALDFTTANYLDAYLNYNGRTGISRTTGFAAQSETVQQKLINNSTNYVVKAECGCMALRYADANLSFRTNSYRVYVNFTDEPNQPNQNKNYSVSWFKNNSNWPSEKGVVHTIYSASDSFTETQYVKENYKPLSTVTGGEYMTANSNFSNINLNNLPVTKAIEDSQIIDIYGISNDGRTHNVRITYLSADMTAVGQTTYSVKFSAN